MTVTLDSAVFTDAVAAAVLAPSMHNSQPWRFRLRAGGIEVWADPARRLAAADPTGWGVRMAIGAAIFNARMALATHGIPAQVTLLPDPAEPDLMARLDPGEPRPATPEETRLHAAISRRHSNRHPFTDHPVPLDHRARLTRAAQAENGWLDLLIGPAAVDILARLAREADRILNADDAYRAEIAAWSRPHAPTTDGVPADAGGPAPEPYDLLARRDFGGPPRAPGRDFEWDPLVGVLGSHADSRAAQLTAGQAMQRVLLTATDLGLAASLISQPIEVPACREQLQLAVGRRGAPQIVLRIGYAIPAPASPRRPLSDVIIEG